MIRLVLAAAVGLLLVAGVGAGTAGELSMASDARNAAVARRVVEQAGLPTGVVPGSPRGSSMAGGVR